MLFFFYFSIGSFVENSGEFAVAMVDHLLDILTKGEHSKAKQQLGEVRINTLALLLYLLNHVPFYLELMIKKLHKMCLNRTLLLLNLYIYSKY